MISLAIALVLCGPAKGGFWEWFQKNEARLADAAAKNPVAVMGEIQDELEKTEDDLRVELMLDATPSLVITADGNASLFADARRVAGAAPKLKRWKVVALRPRRAWVADLEVEGRKFGIADFSWRELGRATGKIDLELAIRGRTDANAEQVDKAAFLVLDVVLGEADTENKIGVIDFVSKATKAHRPMGELPGVVDTLAQTP
ncbi:MAG: hypothetical protein JNK82_27430 [Myxococcaceae bacterium]|nr:hypothetical protein [Myxococcaceae bacterium]